jgi:F420-dependent oxidoreductase-like protein
MPDMNAPLKLGINNWNQYTDWPSFLRAQKRADELGFDSIWTWDHVYPIVGSHEGPMFEGYTAMAAVATMTKRASIGLLVGANTFRNPALVAKMVTTLDHISGGRAVLGIGGAWFETEHEAFGYPFPAIRERMDRLEEALAIARGMFDRERSTYEGRYHTVTDVINVPRPIQPGGPRILVGGGGEQRTLRIAARYADLTHWFPLGMDVLARKTELLRAYCEEIGRDPASIERTMAAPIIVAPTEGEAQAVHDRLPPERRIGVTAATMERAADALRPYIDAGFTGFTFNNNIYRTPERIAALGELLAFVRS